MFCNCKEAEVIVRSFLVFHARKTQHRFWKVHARDKTREHVTNTTRNAHSNFNCLISLTLGINVPSIKRSSLHRHYLSLFYNRALHLFNISSIFLGHFNLATMSEPSQKAMIETKSGETSHTNDQSVPNTAAPDTPRSPANIPRNTTSTTLEEQKKVSF